MTTKLKIIIGSISGFIILLTTSLILLMGRGIDIEEVYFVYEDEDAIYYYINAHDSKIGNRGSEMPLARFDLNTYEFEIVHEDKNINSGRYLNASYYNTPLVYSRTYRDFFNIVTGEFTNIEHFEICSTSQVNYCYAISDDLVMINYDFGDRLYQISTDEIALDIIYTANNEDYDEYDVGGFHYFPTDNKFLYNVRGMNKVYVTENSYNLVTTLNNYYLVDLTTGDEELLSDEITNNIDYNYTLSSDDYLYTYNTDTYTINKYDSSFNLVHSNDYKYVADSNYVREYGYSAPLLANLDGLYAFDEERNTVKLVHDYIGEPELGTNLIGYLHEISPNHVIYKVNTMFLKADYFVIYDTTNNKELCRSTDIVFWT